MAYSEEIKKIHQKCFLPQKVFGRELGVQFSSSTAGKSRLNMSAMKKIKKFCENHNFNFNVLEETWAQTGKEE